MRWSEPLAGGGFEQRPLGWTQAQRLGQEGNGLPVREAPRPCFEGANRSPAESRPLRQLLLRQAGGDTKATQQVGK